MKKMIKTLGAAPIAVAALAAAIGFPGASVLAEDALTAGSGTPLFAGAIALPTRAARHVETSGSVACGIAWHGTIPASGAQIWYTPSVAHSYVLDWSVMADTNATGPGVGLTNVITQQPDATHTVYWLKVQNYSKVSQAFEMRLCILN